MNLNLLKNETLISQTKNLVKEERRAQIEVLLHLQEIERRRLFLPMGFSSLFDFVTKELDYSESAGYRRIQAMRLLRSTPEIQPKIESGSLTLSAAAQLQTFIKSEAKLANSNSKNREFDVLELATAIENKSSRQVEKYLVSLSSNPNLINQKSEQVRSVSETQTEIKLIVDDTLKEKLDQLRLLLSHVKPDMNYQDLISYLSDKALKQLNPAAKKIKSPVKQKPHQVPPLPTSEVNDDAKKQLKNRYIKSHVKAFVWKRDGGCCSFQSKPLKLDGNEIIYKCGSRFQLQIDHIKPFALGGSADPSNLRLLCAQHNRWRAEQTFGVRKN